MTGIVEADLQAAFKDLEPGWYGSADLLPIYSAWAEENGREPVTAKTLGEAVAREIQPQRRRHVKGVSRWWLSKRVLEHREWFTEPGTPPGQLG